MNMRRLKVLAIAVATGRIGYVYLIGDRLRDWGLSRRTSINPTLAAAQTEKWIADLAPDLVVTEKVSKTSTKSFKTKTLIEAIQRVAANANLLDVCVSRASIFKNKYEEARHLGERFPEITAWVPKPRRIWEPEPKNTVLFEALGMGVSVLEE